MELHIPSLKTYVLTCAKTAYRQKNVGKQLNSLHFTNWKFIDGKTGNEHPYWFYLKESIYNILDTTIPPFLILEDDIKLISENYTDTIQYPNDSDVLYLGGGPIGQISEYPHAFKIIDIGETAHQWGTSTYIDIENVEWVRIVSMSYSHSIIFLNNVNSFKNVVYWNEPQDSNFARIQYRYNCFLRRKPFWWQDDGDHQNTIFDLTKK